jgi:hypothetical protein
VCRLAPCALVGSCQYEKLNRLGEIFFVAHAQNEETTLLNGNNLCQMVRDQENELLGEIWKDEVGLVDS